MEYVEDFKAVLNHFGSFLEVTISNRYGGYTGLLRYQLRTASRYPPE